MPDLTPEEVAVLRREFMPRMLVASVVASNPVAALALYKLDPTILPWRTRWEIEHEKTPYAALRTGAC